MLKHEFSYTPPAALSGSLRDFRRARGADLQARVEGFAKRAGKGVAGAMVMLVPKDIEANSEWLRRDQSDLDGSFSLINVIPGDYVLVAIDDGWDLNWSQPGIMAHYLEQGQKVSVSAGLIQLKEAAAVQPK